MKWQARGLNVKLSDAVQRYAERKVRDPLRRFAGRVKSVVVRFKDVDLSCLSSPRLATAVVTLDNGAVIELRHEERCFYQAIDGLADRLRNTLSRRIGRPRRQRNQRRG